MYAVLLAILIILICILFLPFKAEAAFKEKQVTVRIFLANIPVYKIRPKLKKDEEKNRSPEDKVKKVEKDTKTIGEKLKNYAELYKTAVWLLRKYVTVESIALKINVGTGEAATTAVSTGILWGAVYGLIGIIGNIMYINKHNVEINPVYSHAAFSIGGKCIIKSRIAYIIFIAITILKTRKGKEE